MLSLHIMIYILKNLTSGLSFQGEREWEWNTTVDKYGRFHWKFEAQCIQDKQRNMFVKWKRNSVSITWCRFLCLLDFINKHYNSFLLSFFPVLREGFFPSFKRGFVMFELLSIARLYDDSSNIKNLCKSYDDKTQLTNHHFRASVNIIIFHIFVPQDLLQFVQFNEETKCLSAT